ncbi:MAG TPA: ribbon-helix-helix domain-containing protein [Armatimonadota bacterium]|nr:ribbon-helix-helix domain-containing protein [Armatimonadota bacterium]
MDAHVEKMVRTTIAAPSSLFEEADRLIRLGRARNRTDLITRALRHMIDQINREADDAEFALMATDPEYQHDTKVIAGELEQAQWEAFCAGERSAAEGA